MILTVGKTNDILFIDAGQQTRIHEAACYYSQPDRLQVALTLQDWTTV